TLVFYTRSYTTLFRSVAAARRLMARTLPPPVLEEIARLRGLYAQPRSALLPALHAAQEEIGYLTEDAMRDVGDALELPLSEVMRSEEHTSELQSRENL